MKLADLVQLVPGQIIQLQRAPADPVDLCVNNQPSDAANWSRSTTPSG